MADKTGIEWSDATWTPVRARAFVPDPLTGGGAMERIGWHCETVSEGCRNCYAQAMNRRLGTTFDFKPGHLKHINRAGDRRGDVTVFLDETMLTQPLRWKRPRMIFVNSMTDTFADFVSDEMILQIFVVMALAPQHIYQVLTKRAKRMRALMNSPEFRDRLTEALAAFYVADPMRAKHWPLDVARAVAFGLIAHPMPHVWLGVSAEDQGTADERIPELLQTRAAVRWVSLEPLLGQVDMTMLPDSKLEWVNALNGWTGKSEVLPHLDWIVSGGESGHGARPVHSQWIRFIEMQALQGGIPHLFKQWGEFSRGSGFSAKAQILLSDGRLIGRTNDDLERADIASRGLRPEYVLRTGKKRAGRELDGRVLDGYPLAARSRGFDL